MELPDIKTPSMWLEKCDSGTITNHLKRAQCVLTLMKAKIFTFQRFSGNRGIWTTEKVPDPEHLAWFVAMEGDVQPEALSKKIRNPL